MSVCALDGFKIKKNYSSLFSLEWVKGLLD